jgi:hypothetical protein
MRLSILAVLSMMLVACSGGPGGSSMGMEMNEDGGKDDAAPTDAPVTTQNDSGVTSHDSGSGCTSDLECPNRACVNGACVGVCSPGTERCNGVQVERCNTNGRWGAATNCSMGNICQGTKGCQPGCQSGWMLCCPASGCYCQIDTSAC